MAQGTKPHQVTPSNIRGGETEADLKDLDPIIENKELVVFGEADHFLSGIHRFGTEMFRYLAEKKGYRVFLLEVAWGIDEGFADFMKSDRKELQGDEYLFLNAWNSKEVVDLLYWIRDFNRQHPGDPIHLAGFQPEQPVTDFNDLWQFVSRSKKFADSDLKNKTAVCRTSTGEYKTNLDFISANSKRRRAGQHIYTAEERAACNQGLDAVASFIEQNKKELIARSSPDEYRIAQAHLLSLRTYLNTTTAGLDLLVDKKQLTLDEQRALGHKGYSEIDKARAEIFQTLYETRYRGKKIMLWMHNWHAMKHADEVDAVGEGPIPKGTISVGTRLAQMYGKKLVTIGSIVPCKQPCQEPPRADSLETRFAATLGPGSAIIDLKRPAARFAQLPLDTPGSLQAYLNKIYFLGVVLDRQFDGLYYLSESGATFDKK